MELMLSGIKPSGQLTLGNYLGAIKNFVRLQEDYQMMVFVADLHAITTKIDPSDLNKWIKETAALYLACGLDPSRVTLFKQSDVLEHANLGYILTCHTYMGELSRMTQYKDKTLKSNNDSIETGLFIYPPLMAADILLYDAKYVPVGEDQKQHVELTRDIAFRFNNRYGNTFIVPTPIIPPLGARIMSLSEPNKKMSKSSEEEDKGSIRLLDDLKVAHKKVMSAVTDSDNLVKYDVENKPGISNLITIYSSLTNKEIAQIEMEFANAGYGVFKRAVADEVVKLLGQIQERYYQILSSGQLDSVLKEGSSKAKEIASKKLLEVKRKIGFID